MNHKNFVNLIGYCEEQQPFTRMMVFEYAPNGTLFDHLHSKFFFFFNFKRHHKSSICCVCIYICTLFRCTLLYMYVVHRMICQMGIARILILSVSDIYDKNCDKNMV